MHPMTDTAQLCSLARSEVQRGNLAAARSHLSRARESDPHNAECLTLLADVEALEGKPGLALELYAAVLREAPACLPAHLGAGLVKLNSLQDAPGAVPHLRAVVQGWPNNLHALNNLAIALMKVGAFEEAIAAFETIVKAYPRSEGHVNLAAALVGARRYDEALAHHEAASRLALAERRAAPRPGRLRLGRLLHDLQQLEYLRARNLIGPRYDTCVEALRALVGKAGGRRPTATEDLAVDCSEADLAAIAPTQFEMIHAGDGARLPGAAINPALDFDGISRRYHATRPEIMHVDGFLTPEALDKLYRYCLETTMYRREYAGYLGATMEQGFSSPLLFQVISEMQARFPSILRDYKLTQCWVFKHDAAGAGINIHADIALVNINIWITPDEANLDPEGGGLVVWDRESPPDWAFAEYQLDQARIRSYLEQSGARSVRIPYRRNRAAIFNSKLFHKTDNPVFRDSYPDRRLNVTFLFGEGLRT